jgi:hypothetical protein
MADSDKIDTRYEYFWIHNVFGHFVKDTLDYFADYLYPRFTWKVVGSYDKAVEYLNKQVQYARETDQPMRPALICDPSGDFSFDETYGKQPWRYPNLAPGFAKYMFHPIYQDQNVLITVAFSRMIGELNFIGLMSSFYEYTDMRVFLNLIFGGMERYIYPRWFTSFVILPESIYNYRYTNDVTGESYKINIDDAYNKLVKTTATNELVYPCTILPRYKLTSMSDSSSRLGGTDSLPDWKLSFTISYEIELPTFMVLETNYLAETLKVNIKYGSCYTANKAYETADDIPVNIESFESNIDHGLDSTSNSTITFPDEGTINNKKSRLFKTRYYHIVTQSEVDSTSVINISLPEVVLDQNLLRLSGKYGELVYGDHYNIITSGSVIEINKTTVTLELDDMLEISIYQYI